MPKKNIIGIVILVVVVVGGALWWMQNGHPAAQQSSNSSAPSAGDVSQAAATITYSDSGYSPSTITVKSGDTVALKNTSSQSVQFDSDPHPVHTDDPELNVGELSPGQSATFKVITKGTHGYHNHLNPAQKGTIVVQ